MAAETLTLPEHEGEVIAARIVAWTPVLQPQDAYDDWLVEEMVVSSVRIDRCHAHEASLRTRQAARAALCWDVDRECDAEDLGARLTKAPAPVSRQLRRSKQGCAWLIFRWEGLSRILEAKGNWDEAQMRLALDLLGTPKELRDGPSPLDGDRPALIRDQVAQLTRLRAEALDTLDAIDRADAEVGLAPVDKAIALARRYEAACHRRLERAQSELQKNRRAASPAETPTPTAPPAPPVAAPRPQPLPLPLPFRPSLPPEFPRETPAAVPVGENRRNRRARKALARKV